MPIVKDLNVFKNISGCFRPCPIIQPMNSFPFERGKETFGDGVIVTIAGVTHATDDSVFLEDLLKVDTSILATPITVMNEVRNWCASAYGSPNGVQDYITLKPSTGAPPYYLPGIEIEDDRQIQPTFTRGDVSNVAYPSLVRRGRGKILLQPVGSHRQPMIGVGRTAKSSLRNPL